MVVQSETVKNGMRDRLVTIELIALEGTYRVETPFGVYVTTSDEVALQVFKETVNNLKYGAYSSVAI